MAYETKAIFSLLANSIGRTKSVREAYNVVVKAANVEGVRLPTYEEFIEELKEEQQENNV